MSNEINVSEDQLEALMAELEAETGVTAVAAPKADEPVIVEDDALAAIAELEALPDELPADASLDGSMFSEAELAEMQELETLSAATTAATTTAKTNAAAGSLQAGLAALKSGKTTAATESKTQEAQPEEGNVKTSDEDMEALMREVEEANKTHPAPTEPEVAHEPEPEPEPELEKRKPSSEGFARNHGDLKFFIDPEEFRSRTAISDVNLDSCFMEQSGLRAYYGAQAAYAESQASREKARFEILEAKLYATHRTKLAADPAIKITEKVVEAAVKSDPVWFTMKSRVIDAEQIAAVNKAIAVSMADRRDMLIQLGADRRDESKGNLRMQEANDLADRAKTAAAGLRKQ